MAPSSAHWPLLKGLQRHHYISKSEGLRKAVILRSTSSLNSKLGFTILAANLHMCAAALGAQGKAIQQGTGCVACTRTCSRGARQQNKMRAKQV
eukprot:1153430-Pelagomonas_calceolata.AAC.2